MVHDSIRGSSAAFILALAAATAFAAETTSAPSLGNLKSPLDRLSGPQKRECEAFGEAYLRLAELRDAGAAKSVAIERGVEFLDTLGRTGSHQRGMDYSKPVTQFADFVYANPRLQRASLYLYGLSSCAISKLAPDDASFERGITTLNRATGSCQKRFPGQENAKALGGCILGPVNSEIDQLAGGGKGSATP